MERPPLVSIVTPFYNTDAYLVECIESVLTQTYPEYEYLLVNNCSTDSSRQIAERYARKEGRIRLLNNSEFVGQVANYNGALERISPDSKYVKIVQADDLIFPDCVRLMVELAEQAPTVGIVSSYYVCGGYLDGGGVPLGVSILNGRDASRTMLSRRLNLTGSPNTVLYRADIVRSRHPFFPLERCFEDSDAAFEILMHYDLGYIHQMLSFSRLHRDSILGTVDEFNPLLLHYFIAIETFGKDLFAPEDFAELRRRIRKDYFGYLGATMLRRWNRRLWEFHRAGVSTLGQKLSWRDVALPMLSEAGRLLLNPENTLERIFTQARNRFRR